MGGRDLRFYEPETRAFWSDTEDEVLGVDGRWHTSNKATIWRWRSAYQNDFAARMDWTIKGYQAETMHIILAVTDQGAPRLTRYQRVIVTVHP